MRSIKKIDNFVRYDLWRKPTTGLSKWKRLLYNSIRSVVLTVRGFFDNNISTHANALTFSMLFAIVPILALVLAIAKGFGFEQVIQDELNKSFLGSMGMVPGIMGFVERYLDTAQGGAFVGVGLLVLLWSVYSFFMNIESSFNTIWQVKKSRSVLRQFSTYITILLLVPIMMIVSSGLSVIINSTLSELPFFKSLAPLHDFLLRLVPFVICWLVFTWMYWAIPNTKVGLWACLIPGILIGTLFQLLQMLTVYLVVFLSRTSIVYGAFAAIPLLLTWLQLSCLFILSGAELSFAIENNEDFDYHRDLESISRYYKDYVTLFITYVVVHRFEQSLTPQTAHEIAQENELPTRLVNQLLLRLVEVGVLRESHVEGEEQCTYMPAYDINQLTVDKVIKSIDHQGTEQFLENPTELRQCFWKKYEQLELDQSKWGQTLVKDLV